MILCALVLVLEAVVELEDIVEMDYALLAKILHYVLKIVHYLLVIVAILCAIQIRKPVAVVSLIVALVTLL